MYDIGNGIKATGLMPMFGHREVDNAIISRIPEVRAARIERMAKAIYEWQSSKLIPGDRPPWEDAHPRDREVLIEMAGAAYDVL